jgi:THO complex subunit 4
MLKTNPVIEKTAKLYISNLDFGVSNQDIKELFSEFGLLKKYAVNFAATGQSLGTAEVLFANRASAINAVKKYNNVPLDGRPMKLEVAGGVVPQRMGVSIAKRIQQRITPKRGLNKTGIRGGMVRKTNLQKGNPANRGRTGTTKARSAGGKRVVPTQAQLDAELEAYSSVKD